MDFNTRVPVRVAKNAMVAAANPIAATIGLQVLREGGNAIDAAVAIGAAMAVLEPNLSQVGGDLFLQYREAKARRTYALNGSGAAPAGATIENMGSSIPLRGIRAAAVPGAPDGWLTALKAWGTMPAAHVFAPAIGLAEDGHALTGWQVNILKMNQDLWSVFPQSAEALVPAGLDLGTVRRQPDLARTLRDLAEGGTDSFYRGAFAKKLVAYSNANGGFFDGSEMARHRSEILDPIATTYRDLIVSEQPPVSQGLILLEMLNIIEGFDIEKAGPDSADAIHCMAEAKKLAFADRLAYMGDTPRTPLAELISKEYATPRRQLIDPARAEPRYSAGDPYPRQGGTDTTYYCVVDSTGNAVSAIQSVFHGFGCGVVVPDTGVVLNNRMTGFSLEPGHPNVLEPGKRPMHTLNTYLLFRDGQFWAVGGTPGGDIQVQSNMEVITQLVDAHRNPQAAIEAPKWHVAEDGPGLYVEGRLADDTVADLRRRGHDVHVGSPWSGSCANLAIVRTESGALMGGADPRAEALAIGY